MEGTEDLMEAITRFVMGGDERNIPMLESVLHTDFRVNSSNFMGTMGVTTIPRSQYLQNIAAGLFGGLPRKMEILAVDRSDTIASVKIRLESEENHFISYNALVRDVDQNWKLINNLAIVASKQH